MKILCFILIFLLLVCIGVILYFLFKIKKLKNRIDTLAVFVDMARNYANKDPKFIRLGR